jgi:hypothetical protein
MSKLTFVNFAALTHKATHVAALFTDLGRRATRLCGWAYRVWIDWADLYLAIGCRMVWVALALVFLVSLPSFLGHLALFMCEHEHENTTKFSLVFFLGHGVLLPACFLSGITHGIKDWWIWRLVCTIDFSFCLFSFRMSSDIDLLRAAILQIREL